MPHRHLIAVTSDLAEVLGVLIGDGCICRYFQRGRFQFQFAFTAGPAELWYYRTLVKPTLETAFGVSGRLYLRSDNTTRYHIFGRSLALSLNRLGIPIGKKLDASIPPTVMESGQVVPFIRGVYHAEGSVYRRYSKKYNRMVKVYDNLLVVQIRMKLPTLMRQLNDELLRLGINTNRLGSKDGVHTLRITRQSMIRRFFEVIQPRYKTTPRQVFNAP